MSDQEATLDEFIEESDGTGRKSVRWGPKKKTIPSDWDFDPIIDHADEIIYPQRDKPTRFDGNIPWVRIEDLDGIYISEPRDGKRYVSRELMNEMNLRSFPEGTLMCSCSTTMGVCAITAREMLSNQTFAGIVSKDSINTHYLYYAITNGAEELEQVATGSTISYLSSDKLENFHIPRPSLPEQRKIATVLYTVDQAIEKTEEIKHQVERVRNGVRQDVFSHGIREGGTERTTDELKETYLGTVPKDWELRRVDDVCSHVIDCPHSTPEYSEQGTPVVRTSEIEDGRYYPAESPRVDEEGYQKRISRLEPKPGDVVFTREAPIGEAFKIPEGMRLCLGQRLIQLRPKEGILGADFLVELLYSDMIQSWFERSARGSTSTHVNVGDIKKMEIPVPSIEEQRRIVDVLGGFREQLDSEQNFLSRSERLKQGLLQDLLSGTVRTTDTNIEVPDEIAQHG